MSRPLPADAHADAASSTQPSAPLPAVRSCALCLNPFDSASVDQSVTARLLTRGPDSPLFCDACLQLQLKCSVAVTPFMIAAEGPAALLAALRQATQGVMPPLVELCNKAADAQTAATAVCAECGQPAPVFCEQCNFDLCAAHSDQVHSMRIFQSHNVVAMAKKRETLDAAFIRAAAGPLQHLESIVLQDGALDVYLVKLFDGIEVPSTLIYRASRDGFQRKDWDARCLGKGPTMTLVKAKESGFVFGAYTQCPWPKDANSGRVADPTGQSFFFALHNATNYPVGCYLRDTDGAVGLHSSGIRFGDSGPLFTLFVDGRAADDPTANSAFPLRETSSYQTNDLGVVSFLDNFAGAEWFAAAEIEVYQLDY